MRFRTVLIFPFMALIWVYRYTLSPFVGGQCRFYPTCSCYAEQAYKKHGVLGGSYLTLRRLVRCQPWGGCGRDPVPEVINFKLYKNCKCKEKHGSVTSA